MGEMSPSSVRISGFDSWPDAGVNGRAKPTRRMTRVKLCRVENIFNHAIRSLRPEGPLFNSHVREGVDKRLDREMSAAGAGQSFGGK